MTRFYCSVGLTESQAREKGYEIKVGKFDYANLTRAIVSDETDGFIKIVAEGGSGRILGGHIVGAEASSLIHEIGCSDGRWHECQGYRQYAPCVSNPF